MESRAEMEAARLERVAAAKRQRQGDVVVVDLTRSPPKAARRSAPLPFRDGRIGITPTMASPVQIAAPVLSIGDLFASPGTITTAILSTFVVDVAWLLDRMGSRRANVWLVKHWSRQERDKPGVFPSEFPNCRYVHPPMATGYGCVHPKLMVVFHERSTQDRYVRVVISSGNLIQVDYEMMENLVFVQDFPLLSGPGSGALLSEPAAAFRDDLKDYLARLTVPDELVGQLDAYDFSLATARIVASVPGQHRDRFGLHSLRRAITRSNLNLTESEYRSNGLQLECQCSSLGALNRAWLSDFYRAAAGADVAAVRHPDLPPIQVAFPSNETVSESLAGQLGGGSSIRFSRSHWNASTFPREIMRDCISVRTGTLMHSKVVIGRLPATRTVAVGDPVGWIYFGSHNFTRAAWGGTARSAPHLTINNFEMGVLIPVRKVQVRVGYRLDGKAPPDPDPDQVWEQSLRACPVPIPFVRPLPRYDGKTPWFPV